MAALAVFGLLLGCTTEPPPSPPPLLFPAPPLPPPEPRWTWGRVPIKVGPFANGTGMRVMLRMKKDAYERNLLGRGMSRQLMSALERSQAFNVLGYRSAPNETEVQESEGAMDTEAADKSEEESGKAHLEISGTLLAYALSPVSVTGGLNEDPLLHELENDPSANSTFQQLFEKAEGVSEDKISIELRLMDAQAKNEISAIAFHCTSEDWESTLRGWFDEPLRQTLTSPRTPIQQAAQACLIKIVNWVGDKYDSWKKNPEQFLNYRKIQKDLNELGYSCGVVDGKRGSRTETCIQQFLADKKIREKDLESKITEEMKRFSLP
ncbi:MAG: peptidoglycan-binding protein [Candidatus Binatia bacterium]